MRYLVILGFVFLTIAAVAPGRAQVYDEATIEAQLREMYRYHGDRLFKWNRPIRYIVAGFDSEATTQLVRDQFIYLRDLTGLDIRDAQEVGEKGNFVLVFSENFSELADLSALRSVFGRNGQSDAEYRAMLDDLDGQAAMRTITKRTEDGIGSYAVMADPTNWQDNHLTAGFLFVVSTGLTQTASSDVIQPSVSNSGGSHRPMSRLPSFDEAYLRALYSPAILSGIPMDVAIPKLTAAIAAELNN